MSKRRLKKLIRAALSEDVGVQDLTTTLTVSEAARCAARVIARQDGVLSGVEPFRMVFEQLGAALESWEAMADGARFEASQTVISFTAGARTTLTGERTALNFLQRLSGVATLTSQFVKAVSGTGARICDTRKTTPGLRGLEKAAVLHGGGANHRQALYDGILIKENHIAAAGGIGPAVGLAKGGSHHLMNIEVEVTGVDQLHEAIDAGVGVVMLDNMTCDELGRAVEAVKGTTVLLEASGGVTLESVSAIAETGVHYISVGALTHSAPAVDLSLLVDPV